MVPSIEITGVKDGAPYQRRRRLDGRAHHDAPAAVQLLQPGRQLQPALLFARPGREDRARHALPRRSRSRPTPARARRSDDGTAAQHARFTSPLVGEGRRATASAVGWSLPLAITHPAASLSLSVDPPPPAEGQRVAGVHRERKTKTHRRHRPGRRRPVRGAGRGRSGAREDLAAADHPDRQGAGGRRRRQHPLDAVLHADGVGRPRRAVVRARHAGGDAASRATRTISPRSRARARHGAMDRRARRAVPPAGLLSGEGPAAHPAGRRRRDDPPRADPRRARAPASSFRFGAPPTR